MHPELMNYVGETITQMIAFGIFFWILKKFAWPALTHTLDERQRKIEDGFSDIRRRQAEADRLQAEYATRLKGIEAEARQKIQEGVADGRRVAAELAEKARQDADSIREQARRTIQVEMAKARVELRDEIVGMTLGATERLLRERLNEGEQRRLVETFIDDLAKRS